MPPDPTARPVAVPDATTGTTVSEGVYSWLMTVVPDQSQLAISLSSTELSFQVSVAVCYRRNYNTNSTQGQVGEQTATAKFLGGVGVGGGSVNLTDQAVIQPM